MAILAIPLVGDGRFILAFVHPQYVTRAPFHAGAAADTFTLIDYLNSHDSAPFSTFLIFFTVYRIPYTVRRRP